MTLTLELNFKNFFQIKKKGEQMGYDIIDLNGEYQTGFMLSHGTLRDGLRCSAAKAFVRPAHCRKNLHVSLFTLAEKILIDKVSYYAYGVNLKKEGTSRTIYASKEIILSAGAIQSPQMLMLSGIGPRYQLEYLNIDVIVDNPSVGENLQDHVATGGLTFLYEPPVNVEGGFVLPKAFLTENVDAFTMEHKGPIYWLPEAEVMAFLKTKHANYTDDWPDIQVFFGSYGDNTDGGLFGKRAAGLTDDYYTAVYETIIYKDAITVMPLLMRPKSRGKLMLKDDKIITKPLIYPNYYDYSEDLKIMVIFKIKIRPC